MQLEQVERLNKRLQQVGKTLRGDESSTVVTRFAMEAEVVKLKNVKNSGCKHIREILNEIRKRAIQKALNLYSQETMIQGQEDRPLKSNESTPGSKTRSQKISEAIDKALESCRSSQLSTMIRL